MKKLLFLLLLVSPMLSMAQMDKIVDEKISASNSLTDKKIAEIFVNGDTVTVINKSIAGSFVFDTIYVPNNTVQGFRYYLKGFSTAVSQCAVIDVYVTNANGVYRVMSGSGGFTSLVTGNSFTASKFGNLIIIQYKSTSTNVISWELVKTKLGL